MILLKKTIAFIHRDFIEAVSYKADFFFQFSRIFLSVLAFYFLSKLFNKTTVAYLEPYGGDYFAFALIGIAFTDYLSTSLTSFSRSIRDAQLMGTLEAILVTQTEVPTIIISSSLYSFIWTSFHVIIYLFFGVFFSDIRISRANIFGALLILLFTIITFSSIGIISASFIMVLKKGDPFANLFTDLSVLLGGAYFPIAVFPSWLKKFSYLIPLTYSLEGMRIALLAGGTLSEVGRYIIGLGIFSLVLAPFGIISFRFAVKWTKRDGSLTHY